MNWTPSNDVVILSILTQSLISRDLFQTQLAIILSTSPCTLSSESLQGKAKFQEIKKVVTDCIRGSDDDSFLTPAFCDKDGS
jgi:hypothetical protein